MSSGSFFTSCGARGEMKCFVCSYCRQTILLNTVFLQTPLPPKPASLLCHLQRWSSLAL